MAKRGAKGGSVSGDAAGGKTGGPEPAPAPGPGHNGMSDDEKAVEFFAHQKRWVAARAALKIAEEDAKTALGKQAIRDFRTSLQLETPEGEARVKERMEAQLRVARWMAKSVGTQASFLDDDDRTPATERAYAEGKRDGLAGDPCKPAYAPELEQYREYMRGFHDGQAVLARGIKPIPPSDEDRDLRPVSLQRAEAEKSADAMAH